MLCVPFFYIFTQQPVNVHNAFGVVIRCSFIVNKPRHLASCAFLYRTEDTQRIGPSVYKDILNYFRLQGVTPGCLVSEFAHQVSEANR
jgi:hypothetical protein